MTQFGDDHINAVVGRGHPPGTPKGLSHPIVGLPMRYDLEEPDAHNVPR